MKVGQMYENRRTKKVGVLEEADEKYKTVLMRDDEGNSFNITYSTFKSNWRKYTGDKVIQTSSQVEETKEEVQETEKKSRRKRLSREEVYRTIDSSYKIVCNITNNDYEGFDAKLSTKGGILIKVGNSKLCEFWVKPQTNTFNVRLPENYLNPLKEDGFVSDGIEEVYFENEKTCLKYSIRGFALDMLDEIVRQTLDKILNVMEEENEDEEEMEEENEYEEEGEE